MPTPKQHDAEEFGRRMKRLDAELAAIEAAAEQVRRLRLTPPVDDDFPEVKHAYDSSVRTLVEALRDNGRFEGRLDLQK